MVYSPQPKRRLNYTVCPGLLVTVQPPSTFDIDCIIPRSSLRCNSLPLFSYLFLTFHVPHASLTYLLSHFFYGSHSPTDYIVDIIMDRYYNTYRYVFVVPLRATSIYSTHWTLYTRLWRGGSARASKSVRNDT